MSNLLRNKEIKNLLLLTLIITAFLSVAAFTVSILSGIFTMSLGLIFCVLLLGFTYTRYKRLAIMSEQIDKILHGNDPYKISDFDEGELSILQTEIHKMTVRLREQTDNLKKDKRYLSESIADIAHQIRTPLTSINILTSLLSKNGLENEKRLQLVRELETLLLRIDWLVTTLLKISKIDVGTAVFNVKNIAVESLIEKALEPFTIQLELRNIEIIKTVGGQINCDVSWTSEAIGNIIKNSIEHIKGDGIIKIESGQNLIYTQIIISDNGCGFADDDMPHLFERFYKGINADSSSDGIGLALCRMIITEQNGTIKAEKNSPSGARFVIKFYHRQTL
jgi:signal transduction histidine kinase